MPFSAAEKCTGIMGRLFFWHLSVSHYITGYLQNSYSCGHFFHILDSTGAVVSFGSTVPVFCILGKKISGIFQSTGTVPITGFASLRYSRQRGRQCCRITDKKVIFRRCLFICRRGGEK